MMRFYRKNRTFYNICLLFVLSGILFGIFLTAKGGLARTEKVGVFSNYYLHEYAYLVIDGKTLFWIVAKERSKWFFLLWALGLTGAGTWIAGIFPVIGGIWGGIFFAQAFLKQGMAGIGLALLFQFPHVLVYLPLFFWSLLQVMRKSRQIQKQRKAESVWGDHGVYLRRFFTAMAVLLLGILTESYVNSYLVQMLLRIFY